jgi:hypothetical protein
MKYFCANTFFMFILVNMRKTTMTIYFGGYDGYAILFYLYEFITGTRHYC